MKLPVKGFLLQELCRRSQSWDTGLVGAAMADYGLRGQHACNTLHIALDELASAGLIERVNSTLEDGMLQFCYRLTDFGRQRMADTGLSLEEAVA